MQLFVNPHAEVSITGQIRRQIARAIRERTLRPGEPLQREEELAARLVVSPRAVRRAYRSLLAEGLCDRSADEGLRVAAARPLFGWVEGFGLEPGLAAGGLLAREVLLAREAQAGFLPPPVVCGERWRIAGRSLSSGALSGDLYQVVALEDDGVALVVGDVAGKGMAAGLVVAAVQALLPGAMAGASARRGLEELNRRLVPLLRRRQFVALAVARLDPHSSTVEIANAGLPDPYMLRADGQVEALQVPGERLPLGVRSKISYDRLNVTLDQGDLLLLLTDGIPEARGLDGSPIGYEGFGRLLKTAPGEGLTGTATTSGSLPDGLIDRAVEIAGGPFEDDWTVATLELRSPEEEGPCS